MYQIKQHVVTLQVWKIISCNQKNSVNWTHSNDAQPCDRNCRGTKYNVRRILVNLQIPKRSRSDLDDPATWHYHKLGLMSRSLGIKQVYRLATPPPLSCRHFLFVVHPSQSSSPSEWLTTREDSVSSHCQAALSRIDQFLLPVSVDNIAHLKEIAWNSLLSFLGLFLLDYETDLL